MFSNDICPGGEMAETVMCPICDYCDPWILKDACVMSKASIQQLIVIFILFLTLQIR